MVGAVLSRLITTGSDVVVLPAASWTTVVRDCPAPSAVTVCGAGQSTTPEPAGPSSQVQVTVVGVLLQRAVFGVGLRVADTVGAVVSMATESVAVAAPTWFVAVQPTVWNPSPLTEACQVFPAP